MASSPNSFLHISPTQHEEVEEEPTRRRRIRRPRRSRPPRVEAEDGVDDADEVEILDAREVELRTEGEEQENGAGCSAPCEEADPMALPNCPICMERWTPEGIHRVCCIPCGHVYGRSCLERWARHCEKNSAKCPQCNKKFKQRQILNLYAPLIAVASDDLEKEISYLRGKNDSLLAENISLHEEVRKHKMHILQLENSERQMKIRWDNDLADAMQKTPSMQSSITQESLWPSCNGPRLCRSYVEGGYVSCSFVLQFESEIDEARVLDADVSSQIIMISRTVPMLGSGHVITKISLLVPTEMDNILLPPSIGVVKDLHIAPFDDFRGRLALLASLGKKISVFSNESNSIVLQYDLPGPAWSCSWDASNPFLAYAGLQDGKLLVFDIRQTASPLRLNSGPSAHPVHSIHSVINNYAPDLRTLLTASSVGTCYWEGNSAGERPLLIPGMESYGVCISLACAPSSDYMVASFRPKVEPVRNNTLSQISQPCSPTIGHGKVGTHYLLKRQDNNSIRQCQLSPGNVSEVRMLKSAILSVGNDNHMFACGDEALRGLCIWDIPSFRVVQHLKPHQDPILDVKYSCSSGSGLLTSISRRKLQVFACANLTS